MGIKKLIVLIFALVICAFMRKEIVLANDTDSGLVEVGVETLDEGWEASLDCLGYEEVVDENVPFTISFLEGQSENNYDVVDYTTNSLIIGYGDEYVVAAIWATGKAYFYEDGKVHLNSMQINVRHIDGVTYTVRNWDITNTDGSYSSGSAYVDITYKSETYTTLVVVTLTGGSRDIKVNFYNVM